MTKQMTVHPIKSFSEKKVKKIKDMERHGLWMHNEEACPECGDQTQGISLKINNTLRSFRDRCFRCDWDIVHFSPEQIGQTKRIKE